ncbi:glycoside hydrolase family 65 protein [Pelobium manganitolerans]|uniref:glycoside hydrolase family 65 protein n=1 Tax=Pelobium manganitolerans TaxID=1842495 RepID=UPI003FA37CF5
MKDYIIKDEWNVIEEGFDPQLNKISESIFSLGNGRMGQRANFEESYSGPTLSGNYVAGVYYPDKTRVGWWKNGYPEYFAKVLNATNWIGIKVQIEDEELDLAKAEVSDFKRVLNMREGYLQRSFTATLSSGKRLKVNALRFCSIANDELGAIQYQLEPVNFSADIKLTAFLDGDVKNEDSNYDEKFWDPVDTDINNEEAYLTLRTKKTNFEVCTGSFIKLLVNQQPQQFKASLTQHDKFLAQEITLNAKEKQCITLVKIVANLSSQNHPKSELLQNAKAVIAQAKTKGFEALLDAQKQAWAKKWEQSDIIIKGDVAAQQAIRFNIFQLFQTYTGKDDRLNIGPKGFTGEKYGGSTYWDTEAYCVPFYLATAPQQVSKNLLIYRYKQLGKAIENAEKLGFSNGAALFPMVTINGEECHNEWEITFEEIHRNGAIAYAIYNYVRYTGDDSYLADYGLEVLLAISRFWKQRVNWSADKNKFVMLGVTGPNEYENNVNNNWYTNYLAVWCLKYTLSVAQEVQQKRPEKYAQLLAKLSFSDAEFADWKNIVENMYFPFDDEKGVFLQQDGYLDKEQILVKDLAASERPLNQKWSWDRILRSCFIKQADVLQGIYFFEDDFDHQTIKRNFDFYEPRTVHESSLSPCVHSILAAKLNDEARAYEFYLRTARLDLDDYNNDTEDGLHITSMAGTWMSVVEGFAGMRVRDNQLIFNPFLPSKWESFSFKINFRGATLTISINAKQIRIYNASAQKLSVIIHGQPQEIAALTETEISNVTLV